MTQMSSRRRQRQGRASSRLLDAASPGSGAVARAAPVMGESVTSRTRAEVRKPNHLLKSCDSAGPREVPVHTLAA